MLVILATWEVEVEGLKSESCSDKNTRPYLKKQTKAKKKKKKLV
jgi:hypothetical protein